MELLYSCILFAGFSVAYTWDLSEANYIKRQLTPLPRIGRSYYDSKRQGLIPSPRVGRSSFASSYQGFSRDCSLNPELCNNNNALDHWNRMIPHDVHETVHAIRTPLSLAGRRKRSTPVRDEFDNYMDDDDFELTKTLRSNPGDWDWDGMSDDFFPRNTRQLLPVPRVGRSGSRALKNQLISGLSLSNSDDMFDPIELQIRTALTPRVGKRVANKLKPNLENQLWADINEELKRAAVLIPRVGRAAFVPRIGKKAAFVPRIGRSVEKAD